MRTANIERSNWRYWAKEYFGPKILCISRRPICRTTNHWSGSVYWRNGRSTVQGENGYTVALSYSNQNASHSRYSNVWNHKQHKFSGRMIRKQCILLDYQSVYQYKLSIQNKRQRQSFITAIVTCATVLYICRWRCVSRIPHLIIFVI